jgi:hypothetical protein
MAKIIDFYTKREFAPPPPPEFKLCCKRCGADAFTILADGKVCCADCDETCPYHIDFKQETIQ